MAVLLSKNANTVAGELLSDVVENTGLTRVSAGSKCRTLLEAVSKQMGRLYTKMDVDLVQSFLSGATGKYLDFFGELLNKSRFGRSNASITSTQKNIKFYVATGNFGTINGGNSILLPSGTVISSISGSSGVTYKLTYSTILSATDDIQYVAAEAAQGGDKGNIGKGKLVYHNFNGYTDHLSNTLLVTNEAEIQTGQELETDDNYRYRLANSVVASEQANETSIRLAALSTPGVADVIIQPYYRGIGTYDLVVQSISLVCPDGLVSAIQESVNIVSALGVCPVVKKPLETGCSVQVKVYLNKIITETEATTIISDIQRILSNYINNLNIGQSLIINDMVKSVMQVSSNIKDIGTSSKPFEKIYIYKQSELSDGKTRLELTQNYVPLENERVIIETDEVTGDPITVTIEA